MVTEVLFTYYIIREASVVNVNGRRRLIQGYNAVKEELSISSLQQGVGYFEGVAHGSVDVEPDLDGFVPVKPSRFSTAIGLNPLALQATPTRLTTRARASTEHLPQCSLCLLVQFVLP